MPAAPQASHLSPSIAEARVIYYGDISETRQKESRRRRIGLFERVESANRAPLVVMATRRR